MAYEDIECPYCEHSQNINHDDGYGYQEGVTHQQECEKCNKTFVFTTQISFYYEAEKADCLNTDNDTHHWEVSTTYPEYMRKMKCCVCDKEREPTDDEKVKYNIPTFNDYLNSLVIPD